MNRLNISVAAAVGVLATCPGTASAQSHRHVDLHVSDRWRDCAFQLNPALTKEAWRQFTNELGMVMYFRPLRDAAPMGAGKFEVSVVQSVIGIDDHDAAWNDTFVHPDSTHWLFEGSGLPLPGLMGRVGVTDRIDAGLYFTKNPKSNYGVAGGQVQYNLVQQASAGMDASVRASVATLFGPEDVDATVYGLDLVVSKQYPLFAGVSIAPYAGASGYLSTAREKSAVVSLQDERIAGVHAMVGAVAHISILRIAVEYDAASVQSRTMKIGFAF